ncbi:S41 family peptidase [Reichenbachiella versicolor]|uniref:S41 family peptidase n=1 Tax=Reichenbachiella versicolor TaxID=1821036 RepID=UPI000D6E1E1C|nr:S41 family peptidase [Reichenbachiella versicolor]
MKRKHLIIWALIPGIFGLVAFTQSDKYFDITRNLDIFSSLYKEVNKYYVDEVNPNKMIKTGIDAMLEELDPYTVYIPEDDIEDYRTNATGQYGGIGIQSNKINGRHLVLNLYKESPAMKAGMKIGDEIVAIDEQSVVTLSDEEAGNLLKGQSGSKVKIQVLRQGKEKYDFEIERQKISIPNISYQTMLGDDIGYFKLSEFTRSAGDDVIGAVNELKEKGAKKLIIDLRGNPGGLLNQAVKISNLFVPEGSLIVQTKAKTKASSFSYSAEKEPMDLDIPIAVLIDGKSASASEIVSGVIQDYDRGVIVGQNSFGKGLVQVARPLTFNSQLKVTTAKYYIPSGRCIQELDYVHKNADGSASTIADSLRKEFKTQNGRPVFEGKGIKPDVNTPLSRKSSYTKNLLESGLLFDYASEYYYSHQKIDSASEFQLNDEDYADFVSWIGDKSWKNDTRVEKAVDLLKKAAADDKAYKDLVKEIDQINNAIEEVKGTGLMSFKEEIKSELEKEIIKRYYFTSGVIEATLSHDVAVDSAIYVLNTPSRYRTILGNK